MEGGRVCGIPLRAVGKDLLLHFAQHNRSSCRNVQFYKTLSIEFLHGVYLVRNLIVAAIFLVVRGERYDKFLRVRINGNKHILQGIGGMEVEDKEQITPGEA